MCLKCIKKSFTVKNLRAFLRPNRLNLGLFALIIAVHLGVSLFAAAAGLAYGSFISMLYALFNLPVFITSLSLSGYNIYATGAGFVVIPMIAHIIYWYIVACCVRMPIIKKDKLLRYKYATWILAAFLLFAVLSSLWFSLTIGALYPLI